MSSNLNIKLSLHSNYVRNILSGIEVPNHHGVTRNSLSALLPRKISKEQVKAIAWTLVVMMLGREKRTLNKAFSCTNLWHDDQADLQKVFSHSPSHPPSKVKTKACTSAQTNLSGTLMILSKSSCLTGDLHISMELRVGPHHREQVLQTTHLTESLKTPVLATKLIFTFLWCLLKSLKFQYLKIERICTGRQYSIQSITMASLTPCVQ